MILSPILRDFRVQLLEPTRKVYILFTLNPHSALASALQKRKNRLRSDIKKSPSDNATSNEPNGRLLPVEP